MDQPALSFGEGNYESLTLFTTQLTPEELVKQTSIDKLEIPDEKIAAYLPENGYLTSTVLNIPNSLTSNNSQQIRHKSTGRLRGMLSDKENMPRKEESSENKRDPTRSFGENQPVKINQPFATQSFAKKPPVNASFQGLRSSAGFSDSSFAQENKKQDQDRSFDHRLTFQPPSAPSHSRKHSQGNLRIEVENPNTTPAMTTAEVMKDITSKQAEQNYPRSRSSKENENRDDKKPETKPMRKRTPKKVEICLALGADTMKSEQPQKQEEKSLPVPVPKAEQREQRRSAWNSRDRLGDEDEPPFRALSKERTEPSARSLSKASFTEQDVSIEKRESYPKKPALLEEKQVRNEQAPNQPSHRPVYGIKDEEPTENKTPVEEKTVYQRLFDMNRSRRGYHKNGSVPALNDSETYHDRANSYSKNDSNFYMKNSFTFQPKLESKSRYMKRDEKVDSLLYKDAIRRQNKSLENICSQVPTPSNYTLQQSNKLMAKKFIREFEDEISAFFGIAQERKFNYAQLTEFLKTMKFVKGLQDMSTHAIHEKTLVDMIWGILKGDKYRGVNERNLLLFLLAIMGLHIDIPNYTPKTTANVTPNVSDKIVFPIQMPKIDSNAPSERNPSAKRESMWKKRQEAELTEALMKSSAQENEPEKETLALGDVRSPSVNSNATGGPVKMRLSLMSDHTENAEPSSFGLSNIFAQKLSFQSEQAKQPESQVFAEPEVNQEDNLVGIFDNEENISFTEEEVQRISQTYDMFYSNRLYASKSLTKKMSKSNMNSSFEPEILEYSRQLAFNYREKQIQNLEEIIVDLKDHFPSDKKVTHADLLISQGLSTKNKLTQQRQKSIEKQLEECTFRPNLVASTRARTPGRQTFKFEKEEPNQSRGEHLYNLAKKSEKAKVDRSTRVTEQRKVYEKCSFRPDLDKSRRSQSRSKVKAQNVSKDFDKSVERMKRGREQREQVRMATENRAQNLDDKNSQFKFTLEKIHGRKDSFSSTKKGQLDTSNVESTYNKKAGYMSFVNGQKAGDSSFASFDTRDNYQHVAPEPEEMIYQTNIQNNNKILNESNYNQTLNKFLSQTYGNLTEDPTTHPIFLPKAPEKVPLLFIDVNFGGNKSERIAVYEGDTAEGLATHFASQNSLNDHLKSKLTMLLQSHMSGILSKIDEEMPSTQSEIQRIPPIQGSQGANKFR